MTAYKPRKGVLKVEGMKYKGTAEKAVKAFKGGTRCGTDGILLQGMTCILKAGGSYAARKTADNYRRMFTDGAGAQVVGSKKTV